MVLSTIREKFTLIVSSSAADLVQENGSSFVVNFEQPIALPKECHNPILKVVESDIFNVNPNLSAPSTLVISGLSGSDVTVTLPVSIYDLTTLNGYISRELKANDYDENLYRLSADPGTGKVIHITNDVSSGGSATLVVGYGAATTALQTLVGQTVDIAATQATYEYFVGQNVAQFNNTQYFLIKSDICNGIPENGEFKNLIGKHVISAGVGAQSVYEPITPLEVPCDNLRGSGKASFRFFLRDQNDNPVNLGAEPWSVNIIIEFDMPIVSKGV